MAMEGWTKRAPITIPSAQVGSGGVTDFSVLLTEASLPASLFTDAKADGSDIRVTTDEAGTALLTVDVIAYNAGGTAVLRVGPVSLSSVSANTLYVWFGNAAATAQTGSGAYDADWAAYWPDGGGTDHTANGRDGTPSGGLTIGGATGQVGEGTEFDGSDDLITYGDASWLDGIAVLTLGVWVNLNSTAADILSDWQAGGNGHILYRVNGSNLQCYLNIPGQTGGNLGVTVTTGVQHLAMVYDGSTITGYRNGVAGSSPVSASGSLVSEADNDLQSGRSPHGTGSFIDGVVDEPFIHTAARSPAWITTEYNATNAPASFATAGTVEDVGGDPEPTAPIFRRSLYNRIGSRGLAA